MDVTREDTLKKKEDFNSLIKERNIPQKIFLRAKIAKKIQEGMPKKWIAEELNISRSTVYLWALRYEKGGVIALLKDAPRPGRIPLITPQKEKKVVEVTLHTIPHNATHWSARTMAVTQSISRMAVQRKYTSPIVSKHLV
jgi:transposase